MSGCLTARSLFELSRAVLALDWVAGTAGEEEPLALGGARAEDHFAVAQAAVAGSSTDLSAPVVVIGRVELSRWSRLRGRARAEALQGVFAPTRACVVLAGGQPAPRQFLAQAEQRQIPLLVSPRAGATVVRRLRGFVQAVCADSVTLHGVYVDVLGCGVLLTGESGVGKSELALELISRGHRLVADDAPTFSRVAPGRLLGCAPEMLRDLLEVRGLGVINIRAAYGGNALKPTQYLTMVIHLQRDTPVRDRQSDRLQGNRSTVTVLGVAVPRLTLPVASGRNLAVLVETAVRMQDSDTGLLHVADELSARQQRALAREQ